jgi:hypothetical protein
VLILYLSVCVCALSCGASYLVVDLDGEVDEVGVLLDDLLDAGLVNQQTHRHKGREVRRGLRR